MKISVIVPVYNVEKYLRQCIDSVMAQTFTDWEMIMVDDGSTDESGKIADEYAEADDRITVIHQQNRGLSAARNVGIDAAHGEYIYFLDSDDYIVENTFDIIYNASANNDLELLIFNGTNFSEDNNGFSRRELLIEKFQSPNYVLGGRQLFCRMMESDSMLLCCVPLQFVRRESLLKSGIRFKEGMLHEDNLYSFMLFMSVKSVMVTNEALYMRRVREGSITNSRVTIRNIEGWNIIYNEITGFGSTLKLTGSVRKCVNQYLRIFFMNIAANYYGLPKEERRRFSSRFDSLIKLAAANNYNDDRSIMIICRFRHIYGAYKRIMLMLKG